MAQISVSELLLTVWRRRRWLVKFIAIGSAASLAIALLIPRRYTSTVQLMPPDQQMLSTTSMLNILTGSGISLPSVGSSLMNQRTPGSTAIGILSSRTVQDDIIDRFDLRRVYHRKYYVDARKDLTERTVLDEDRKTGIVSIAVSDHDPHRARDIAAVYVEELDKLVNTLSTSSARREREFLETRLKSLKVDLDARSLALSQFSSRNATFDPAKQGEATIEATAKSQAELITAQSELSGLKAMYTADNMRVREVRARIAVLQSQLQKLGGAGTAEAGADLQSDELMPSIRQLPLLGFTYYDLYRQVAVDESVYETLTKQYELAKVQEAKDIPPIKVLDAPDVPERHSFPHGSIFLIVGAFLSAFAGAAWIVISRLWSLADDSSLVKIVGRDLVNFSQRRKSTELQA
jgi:uncharacterized protein involved in exopolysaccharide biosynthesis